jgi:hypothetical protein
LKRISQDHSSTFTIFALWLSRHYHFLKTIYCGQTIHLQHAREMPSNYSWQPHRNRIAKLPHHLTPNAMNQIIGKVYKRFASSTIEP